MTSSRFFARAGALTFAALTFSACGGDSTSPLELDPTEFEALGESVAYEIESSVLQLTADGAYPDAGAPLFSIGSRASREVLGSSAQDLVPSDGAVRNLIPSRQMVGEGCGVPSQQTPTDSDADGVPDNLTVTFALPECHIVTADGTMDITGLFRISDPTPGTAGMALSFALDNFRVAIAGAEFSGSVLRDGGTTVAATATGLSQTQEWSESVNIDGFPGISANIDWTATFAAAQGLTITPGSPLPDGTFTPGGTFVYRQGNQQSAFSVETTQALQYSAECAAQYAEGLADSPFTSGQLRVAYSGQEGAGYVRITYTGCSWADVIFIAAN